MTLKMNLIKTYYDQPIILADLVYQMSLIDGVSAVVPPTQDNPNSLPIIIENQWKTANGYSCNIYDINEATKDGVIYPSMDPSCFELKYPDLDIQGRALGDM